MNGLRLLSEITFLSRYARPDLDIWRYGDACRNLFGFYRDEGLLSDEQYGNVIYLAERKALFPSMRSVQFQHGFLTKNERMYNCSGILIDSIESIYHSLYLLLCGCGVGFNISREHICKLPTLVTEIDKRNIFTYEVEDDVKGWAKAALYLLKSYAYGNELSGKLVLFDYSKITPRGVILRSCGRPAPGPEPLKESLESVRKFLDSLLLSATYRLRPIHVYDIICMLASCVMAGGVRRSALIALFDYDDDEMINAKVGDWFSKYPWRSYSNNSAIYTYDMYKRGQINKDSYIRLLEVCLEYGEPGVVHLPDVYHVVNPCVEIVFHPVIDGVSGYQMCNLVEVCVPNCRDSDGDLFFDAVSSAAIIGTVQYRFHDFLSPVAKEIAKQKPLIGLSLTGLSDVYFRSSNGWYLSSVTKERLYDAARLAVSVNEYHSRQLGLVRAERVTCVKPSGTVSCIAGCSSGVHPWYSDRYIRNINVRMGEPSYKIYRRLVGHEGIEHSIDKTVRVIGFPIQATGRCNWDNTDPVSMVRIIKDMYDAWVIPGSNGVLNNAVSCTILYQKDDIDRLAGAIYEVNRTSLDSGKGFALVGVSFLPRMSEFYGLSMPFVPYHASSVASVYYDNLAKRVSEIQDNVAERVIAQECERIEAILPDAPDSVYRCDNELCQVK